MAITRKLHYKAVNDDLATHVGKPGDIFYDPEVAELRMYDGNPGGMVITGGGGNASLPVYVDPAPVAGNYMSVAVADYGTVIITGNLTNNFTLNLQDDALSAPDNGVTLAAKMEVIFTNTATNYKITGLRAGGSWGGGDTLVNGSVSSGTTTLAQVFLTVTGDGTPNPTRTGYIVYTPIV